MGIVLTSPRAEGDAALEGCSDGLRDGFRPHRRGLPASLPGETAVRYCLGTVGEGRAGGSSS
jgi:hypothetical protein